MERSVNPSAPLISIITVNYRQPAITCELLASLAALDFQDFEVIVVENSPLEDSSDSYRAAFPAVRVVNSPENLGFAGGNNLGIRAARGTYLFFVNNDTELVNGTLEQLLPAFDSPEIGMVCPKIRYHHSPEFIQFAGFTEVDVFGRNTTLGNNERDQGQQDVRREIPYGHGAAMMVHRRVIEQVGLMPELFFLYYEELDWCAQITRAGFKIVFTPESVIYHKESMTVGKMNPMKTYYMTRNRIWFMHRNMPAAKYRLFALYFYGVALPKNLLQHSLKGEWAHVKAFWKGAREALFQQPTAAPLTLTSIQVA